jgi:hypothetical protein
MPIRSTRTCGWQVRVTPEERALLALATAINREQGYAAPASTVTRLALLTWAQRIIKHAQEDGLDLEAYKVEEDE